MPSSTCCLSTAPRRLTSLLGWLVFDGLRFAATAYGPSILFPFAKETARLSPTWMTIKWLRMIGSSEVCAAAARKVMAVHTLIAWRVHGSLACRAAARSSFTYVNNFCTRTASLGYCDAATRPHVAHKAQATPRVDVGEALHVFMPTSKAETETTILSSSAEYVLGCHWRPATGSTQPTESSASTCSPQSSDSSSSVICSSEDKLMHRKRCSYVSR